MAITRDEAKILAHEDPAALFAAQVSGEPIVKNEDEYCRPCTCRLDLAEIAYLDALAKRRKTSRAQVMAELIEIAGHLVMQKLPKEAQDSINDEISEALIQEMKSLKKGGGK